MAWELPDEIRQVGFTFHWDNKKVWALELPVEEIPIEDLEWHFHIKFWGTKEAPYDG